MLFSERIDKRMAVWWGQLPGRRFYGFKDYLHRLQERHISRDRNDTEAKWRCCEFWQRSLEYKWNAREFAQRHGCRVPALYWFGRRIRRLPFDSLPDHYVVKPNCGWSRKGVHLMVKGIDLLSQERYSKKQLEERLRDLTGRFIANPILIEEFITENGLYELPTDYRCHMFGDVVGAIQVVKRAGNDRDSEHRFYTARWEIFEDPMITNLPQGIYVRPPPCLEEMLTSAKKLGGAYGTYVRIDFHVSKRGCVFGEFTSFPSRMVTEYADEYLGTLWQKTIPDEI